MTINNYLKKERFFLLCSVLALFSLVSCQKQPNVTFGSTYVADNNGANIILVDTATVNMSTLEVDSTNTAGTGFLQVGKFNDPYFGIITSRAFFQVAPPATHSVGTYDTYDSIGMILIFKKANPFYGDSTTMQTYVVNQIDTLFQLGYLQTGWYSNYSLPLNPTVLGTGSAMIAPNIPYTTQGAGDTVKIRMDDNLGKDLFNKIYNNSDTISNSAIWLQWFHGLCISPGPTSQGAIYGFQDSAVMRIYYHKAGVYSVQSYLDFGLTQKSFQFNNITVDRSASPLQHLIKPVVGLNPQVPPATPSALTANATYVQTITGLNVKLTFPNLQNIALRPDYLSLLRAQLIVRPDPNSFSTSRPLPPTLGIYVTDLHNLPGAQLPASTGGTQTGSLVLDYLHPLNMFYTYDVTTLVKALITSSDPVVKQEGLILSTANYSSFARTVLADMTYPVNQRITLNVYYISLYPHN